MRPETAGERKSAVGGDRATNPRTSWLGDLRFGVEGTAKGGWSNVLSVWTGKVRESGMARVGAGITEVGVNFAVMALRFVFSSEVVNRCRESQSSSQTSIEMPGSSIGSAWCIPASHSRAVAPRVRPNPCTGQRRMR